MSCCSIELPSLPLAFPIFLTVYLSSPRLEKSGPINLVNLTAHRSPVITLTKNQAPSHYDFGMPVTGEFPPAKKTRRRRSDGFSTTELLMVVALASIVLALTVPQIRQSLSSYRLSSTAERLSAELNMGRMLAISRNAIFEIQVDQEQGAIQIVDPDDPENPPRVPKPLEPGITFVQVPGTAVRFFSRGHARPGAFVIQDEFGNSISIEVNESGLIEVSGFQEQ